MSTDFIAIGERIRGIREACDVTAEDMAADLDVDLETYIQWEETGADVPISAIYHMANRFGIEFTEILTGKSGHLDTFHLIKAGEITGGRLATIHNLRYLLRLMERIRKAIEEDRYEEFRSEFFSHYDMSRNF